MDALHTCGLANRTLWVDPSGSSAYQAYCSEGGWALALRVDGKTRTLAYSSGLWTNSSLLNPSVAQLASARDAKLQPFVDQPGVAIRVVMTTSNGAQGAPVDLFVGPFTSLRGLFTGGFVASSAAAASWRALVPGGATWQANCGRQGANVFAVTPPQYAGYKLRVFARLGILMNQERDCYTPDSVIGVGMDINSTESGDNNWGLTSGNLVAAPRFMNGFGDLYNKTVAGYFSVYVLGEGVAPTATSTASGTAARSRSPSRTASATASLSELVSPSQSGSNSPTRSRSPTGTPSSSPSGTGTPTASPSGSLTSSPTRTDSTTPSITNTLSPRSTPSTTATGTATGSASGSPSISGSASPSVTPTATRTPSATGTGSASGTASASTTASITASIT